MKTRIGTSGYALGMVLIVLGILSVLGVGFMQLGSTLSYETGSEVSDAQAFWAAEAGLERIKSLAQKQRRPFEVFGLHGIGVLAGTTASASYSVDVVDDPGWINLGNRIKRYIITSTGASLGGRVKAVQVHAEIETFASYLHCTHSEHASGDNNIYFVTGDILDGPIYVNDQLNLWGTPVFRKRVRSAAPDVNYRNGATVASFEGGLMLNAAPLDFSGAGATINEIESAARSGGLVLDDFHHIEFGEDGRITYWKDKKKDAETNWLSNLNGAIYVDGSCEVSGVVNGRVSIAAEERIEIHEDGIVYESARSPSPYDPGFNEDDVDDALGLIARDEVLVLGEDTISIHASILVTEGDDGFNADHKYDSIGMPYLNLYGALGQYRRGVVGRTDGLGFLKNYKYDYRFIGEPPPFFPYSAYRFDTWRAYTP